LVATLLLGACFLLLNLGARALWTDEAETALLARNIQRFDLPRAFDGVNYVSQSLVAGREDFNESGIWVLSPWLQLYVTAGSFALFGSSPGAARLPFALIALASVWMIYRLALIALRDRRIARLAALLLVFCIPFLLHARQARYYALVMFLATAAIASYLRFLDRRPRAAVWLVLSIALLFHASYAAWLPIAAGLAIHAALFARSRIGLRHAAAIGAGVLALVAPWALYARIDRSSSLIDPSHFAFNLLNFAITLNHYVLPLAWIAVAWALARFARTGAAQGPARMLPQPLLGVVLCLVASNLLFASVNANYFFRYVIQLVPLLVLVHAALLIRVVDLLRDRFGVTAGRVALLALVPVALVTTLPSLPVFPLLQALESLAPREPWADDPLLRRPRADFASPRSEIFDFLHEITHPYRGPDAGIAEFLSAHADPSDVVFMEYGDLPLIFATGLAVRGGTQGVPYSGQPDWIVARAFESPDGLRRFAREHGYREHILDVVDTRWENQPDPYSHKFREEPATRAGNGGYRPIAVYSHPRKQAASTPSPDELQVPVPQGALPPARAGDPPNVLLISLDSLRADRVVDWAAHFSESTRLARLASASTLFALCRTVSPGTASAAASLLTGRNPRDLGTPGPTRASPAGVPTLASLLRATGYQSAAVLPNVTLPEELGLAAGFDRWLAPPAGIARREDFAVTREARHWLLSRSGSQPWLLWVHLNAAHGPYRAAINPFGSMAPFAARVRVEAPSKPNALRVLTDNSGRGGVPAYQFVGGASLEAQYRRLHDVGTLVGDFYVGELLDTLQVLSADPNTIVAVVGTHGESLGEAGVDFNHGENLDDSALRVPLIIHVPGQVPAVVGDPVSILDVLPTLLALVGSPLPPHLDGVDLAAIWRGGRMPTERPGVPSVLDPPQGPEARVAVSGRRYRVERDAAGAVQTIELPDPALQTGADPVGTDAERAALLGELERIEAREPAGSGPPILLTAERRAALVSLGYVAERLRAVTE
jgi:hypothetical protein